MEMYLIPIAVVIAFFAAYIYWRYYWRMDKRIKLLAYYAYQCAINYTSLPRRGIAPPVKIYETMKGRIGFYRPLCIFRRVLIDGIGIIDDEDFMFPNLLHEMIHGIRRRNGLKVNEPEAERAEASAMVKYGGPRLKTLLNDYYRPK